MSRKMVAAAEEAILAGMTNREVLAYLQLEFPDHKFVRKSVYAIRSRLKQKGHNVAPRTVGDYLLEAMLAGASNREALDYVKSRLPYARTTYASVGASRSRFRREGYDV